jgi:uncharacterized low-complexity protein
MRPRSAAFLQRPAADLFYRVNNHFWRKYQMSMSKKTLTPIAAALGTTFVVSLAASPVVLAAENPFALNNLSSGYMVAEEGKCGEGKCGENKDTSAEGKCGEDKEAEGKCGENKEAEGKCGENKDTSAEGKCGEGKCGEKQKAHEGKCGEGKCGENK